MVGDSGRSKGVMGDGADTYSARPIMTCAKALCPTLFDVIPTAMRREGKDQGLAEGGYTTEQ